MATLAENLAEVDVLAALVAAASGGDAYVNDGTQHLFLRNQDVGSMVVTLTKQTQSEDDERVGTKTDYVLTIPASDLVPLYAVHPKWYNDGSGLVQITYSSVTSLTVAVFKLPGVLKT